MLHEIPINLDDSLDLLELFNTAVQDYTWISHSCYGIVSLGCQCIMWYLVEKQFLSAMARTGTRKCFDRVKKPGCLGWVTITREKKKKNGAAFLEAAVMLLSDGHLITTV